MCEYDAKLKSWKLLNMGDYFKLSGMIFEDTKGRFQNGEFVYTSMLKLIDFANGIAKTSNTTYKLLD